MLTFNDWKETFDSKQGAFEERNMGATGRSGSDNQANMRGHTCRAIIFRGGGRLWRRKSMHYIGAKQI